MTIEQFAEKYNLKISRDECGDIIAIELVGAKQRRVMSPAQRAALEKARLASPLIPGRTVQDGPLPA